MAPKRPAADGLQAAAPKRSNQGDEYDVTFSDEEEPETGADMRMSEQHHLTARGQAEEQSKTTAASTTQSLLPQAGTRPSQYLASQSETFAMVTKAGLTKRQHKRSEKKKQKKQQEKTADQLRFKDIEGTETDIIAKEVLHRMKTEYGLFENAYPDASELEEQIILHWKEVCIHQGVPEDSPEREIESDEREPLFNLLQATFKNRRSGIQSKLVPYVVEIFGLHETRMSPKELTKKVNQLIAPDTLLFTVPEEHRNAGRHGIRYVGSWVGEIIEHFFIYNESKNRRTTEQKREFINKINTIFIAMIFTMVHMTILKHQKGTYDKNHCARDETIEKVYKAHLAAFRSFYAVPSRRDRYFATQREFLLARLEQREGKKDPTIVIIPKDGDLDDLDAYFSNQESNLEKMKQAIVREREG